MSPVDEKLTSIISFKVCRWAPDISRSALELSWKNFVVGMLINIMLNEHSQYYISIISCVSSTSWITWWVRNGKSPLGPLLHDAAYLGRHKAQLALANPDAVWCRINNHNLPSYKVWQTCNPCSSSCHWSYSLISTVSLRNSSELPPWEGCFHCLY